VRQRGAGACGTVDCCHERESQTHIWEAPPGGPHRPVGQGARQPHLTIEHAHPGLPVGRPPFARSNRSSPSREIHKPATDEGGTVRAATTPGCSMGTPDGPVFASIIDSVAGRVRRRWSRCCRSLAGESRDAGLGLAAWRWKKLSERPRDSMLREAVAAWRLRRARRQRVQYSPSTLGCWETPYRATWNRPRGRLHAGRVGQLLRGRMLYGVRCSPEEERSTGAAASSIS
jgi:hypothetical protein